MEGCDLMKPVKGATFRKQALLDGDGVARALAGLSSVIRWLYGT